MESLAPLAHQADERLTWVKELVELSDVGARFHYRVDSEIELTPLVAIEIARQAMHCFAHLQLKVPLPVRSLLTRAAYSAVDGAQFAREGELKLLCRAQRSAAGKKTAVTASVELFTGCVRAVHSEIEGVYLDSDLFERVEQMSRSTTTNPTPTFAERAREVLRLGTRKPQIDAPHAHLAGMQIVERALDATQTNRTVRAVEWLEAKFTRVGSANEPIEIKRQDRANATVAQVRQQGADIAQVQVRFAAFDQHLAHD